MFKFFKKYIGVQTVAYKRPRSSNVIRLAWVDVGNLLVSDDCLVINSLLVMIAFIT